MMNISLSRMLSARLGTLHFQYTPIVSFRGLRVCLTPYQKKRVQIPALAVPLEYSTSVPNNNELSLWVRIKERIGIQGQLRYPKPILKLAGYKMYLCLTQLVNYEELMEVLKLPDTFNSWFLITKLHVWLCMVRLEMEAREGRHFRNYLVEAMWDDVDKKSKKLGDTAASSRKEGIANLAENFHATVFSYDEGLMGDDRDLAASLWRILFDRRHIDPQLLETMVAYIRKQAKHLERQDSGIILTSGFITLLPLFGDKVDTVKHDFILNKIEKEKLLI